MKQKFVFAVEDEEREGAVKRGLSGGLVNEVTNFLARRSKSLREKVKRISLRKNEKYIFKVNKSFLNFSQKKLANIFKPQSIEQQSQGKLIVRCLS